MSVNILLNFPTNLGDAILALPTLDKLKANYPEAKISAIVSPKTKEFFIRNNFIDEIVMFDKLWKSRQKMRFSLSLRGKYDIIVDLKNSFFPIILGAKLHTPFIRRFPKNLHIKEKYLKLVGKIAPKKSLERSEFVLTEDEKARWDSQNLDKSIFIACGSLSRVKEYPYENLREVIEYLRKKYKIVILGIEKNRKYYKDILSLEGVVDLVGKTEMIDVYYLVSKHAHLILGVDSSLTHLASYIGIPAIAIFGPTSYKRSYPWSKDSIILQKNNLECLPCEKAKCVFNHECMKIEPEEVIEAIEKIMGKIKHERA